MTVVRTSSLFGHVTKPAPAPVNIEKLQEEAQKVYELEKRKINKANEV